MKFIVKALICFAALCVTTAYAFDNKEFSRGEIKYSDYLPGNGWTLPGVTRKSGLLALFINRISLTIFLDDDLSDP